MNVARKWMVGPALVAAIAAGCVPSADPLCTAGEAYCVVRLEQTCDEGLRPHRAYVERFSEVEFEKDGESDEVWICCPEGQTTEECKRQADRESPLQVVEGATSIEVALDADEERLLRLAAGAEFLQSDYSGVFESISDPVVAGLPALPSGQVFETAFALDFDLAATDLDYQNDSYLTLPKPSLASSDQVAVYAIEVVGGCSGSAEWVNGPRDWHCGVKVSYGYTSADSVDTCPEYEEEIEHPSLCQPEGRIATRQRILLCDSSPCSWQRLDSDTYDRTSDGRVHFRPPFPGVFTAVAD